MQMVAIISFIYLVVSSMLFESAFGKTLLSSQVSQQPILTLKTPNGQLYDCVNFYKQPSLNNLALKSHISKVALTLVSNPIRRKPNGIGFKHGGCPSGTVPILRNNVHASNPALSIPISTLGRLENCVAAIQTTLGDSNRRFIGSNAAMTIYKPQVQKGQWSTTRIKLLNGGDSIEAGWMVNPTLFNDTDAHIYTRYIAGQKVCVNLQCNGFVQVSKDVPLGMIAGAYSEIGGEQYSWNMTIEKHTEDGNWWYIFFDGDNNGIPVGYLPKNLFTSLTDFADQVEWGGEIYNPGPRSPSPEMGSGKMADYKTKDSSFIMQVTVDTENSKKVGPQDTNSNINCPSSYNVLDVGYVDDHLGRVLYYGGYKK